MRVISGFPQVLVAAALWSWAYAVTGTETEAVLEIGAGYLDDDAYQFGNHAGVNEQGIAPVLNFDLRIMPEAGSAGTAYWQARGLRIGLDTPRLQLEAGQQGTQRLRLDYRGNSLFRHDDAVTPLRGVGSANLSLPGGWQAADSTTGLTTLEENFQDINLWQQRRSLALDYRRLLGRQWTLHADLRRERVDGLRSRGGATGSTGGNVRSLLVPVPLDYETNIAALSIAYGAESLRWSLGYQGSFFDNGENALSWPTIYSAHPQWAAGTGFPDGGNRMALEPDNEAHRLHFDGSLTLGGGTRLYLDAALGRQSQDESFLPYTVNPALPVTEPLPRDSLDARVDTRRLSLHLNARPLSRLNLRARVHYRDRDNRTPVNAYRRVRGDAVAQQDFIDARVNRPYGLTESGASVDAAFRLASGLRLESGYGYTKTQRDFSEVHRTGEHAFNAGIRSTALNEFALALDYRHLRRRGDDYIGNLPLIATHVPGSVDADDFENHPLLRKYYLTDRDRNQVRLRADWYPLPRLTLGTTVSISRDDYAAVFFGLNESEMMSAAFDVAYNAGENLNFSAFVSHDRYDNEQSGRSFRGFAPAEAFDPARNWEVTARDRFNVFGFNIDWEGLRPRFGNWQSERTLDLSLELNHSRSRGEVDTSVAAGLQSAPLPDLTTRRNVAAVSARYHLSPRSSLRLALEHERYRGSDFALDGVAPDAIGNVLLMGLDSPRYRVNWFAVSYRHRF